MNIERPNNNTKTPARPTVERVTVNEEGEEGIAPRWVYDENQTPSDACLKEFVLVGSIPED